MRLALAALVVSACAHPLSTPRRDHTASSLFNGDVLVVGGTNSYPPTASVARYDADKRRWRAAAALPEGRQWHAATTLANGRVLVTGGYTRGEALRSTLLYDPAADRWRDGPPLQNARRSHSAARLSDGRVLVVGGNEGEVSAELFDPARGEWTLTETPPASPSGHTVTALGSAALVVGNVFTDTTRSRRPAALLYDARSDRWRFTGTMRHGRVWHTATRDPAGRVFVIGGRGHDPEIETSRNVLSSVEIYEPQRDAWREGPPLRVGRSDHSATLVGARIVVVGGSPSGSGEQRPLASIETLDTRSSTWGRRHRLARNREEHTANLVHGEVVLIVGGRTEPFVSKWSLRWSTRVRTRR